MTPETIEQLRESVEKDLLAARLLDTAALFIVRGWCRFNMARNERGDDVQATDAAACRWCASGALTAAQAQLRLTCASIYGGMVWDAKREPLGQSASSRARGALAEHLKQHHTEPGRFTPGLTQWNDDGARTKAQVIFAFRDAAGSLRLRIEAVAKRIRGAA